MSECRLCAVRARNNLGPCGECRAKPPARIASAEPVPAETFDPVDVLETSLRQARAVQRRLQEQIEDRGDTKELVELHGALSRAIGQLVPTWQRLREADLKKLDDLTPEQMEDAMEYWFLQQSATRQRAIHQKLARRMNGEVAS